MSAIGPSGRETPFDLLVLADFLPEGPADAPLRLRPHRVDAASFGDLLKEAAPTLSIDIGGGKAVSLRFDELRAFRPEALPRRVVSVPPAALPEAAPPSAPPPAAPPPQTSPSPQPPKAGELFDLVDVDGSTAETGATETQDALRSLDRLIQEIAGGGVVRNPTQPSEQSASQDAAAAEGLRQTLHEPRLRALESAWRGLAFLLRRLDSRSGFRVHVLSAPAGERVDAFRNILLPLAVEMRAEARTVVALVDADFGGDEASLAEARELAGVAEEARIPVVASADPRLLGLSSWKEIQSLGAVDELLNESPPPGWTALRSDPAARWLTLAANPFLLRLPYGAEQDRVKGFAFEENPPDREPVYLWGRPAWIVGSLIAEAAIRDGWGAAITGPAAAAEVNDLPVRLLALRGGEPVQIPLEMLLPENRVLELSRAGLAPLACARNRDRAFLPTAPSVAAASAPDGSSDRRAQALRVSLPYQVFTARVTALIDHLLHWMGPTQGPEETAVQLAAGLEVLTATSEGAEVAVTAAIAEDGATLVLRVTPRGEPVRGLPPLELRLPLGGH